MGNFFQVSSYVRIGIHSSFRALNATDSILSFSNYCLEERDDLNSRMDSNFFIQTLRRKTRNHAWLLREGEEEIISIL